MEPKKPHQKRPRSKVRRNVWFVNMMTRIIRFVNRITLNVILVVSKPTLSDVRCLIKSPLSVNAIGVTTPPSTAAQVGTTYGSNILLKLSGSASS